MARIFISYRRDDSAGQAGRLFDHLTQRFGEDSVFMDVDTIDLGRDFKPALQDAVRGCDMMLVVIGPDWLDCSDAKTGTRRLDNANDWVRIEIAEALKRGIPVIPVLVRGAGLLAADRLPGDIAALADRQATAISDHQWRAGVADLVARLEAIPRRTEREEAARWLARIGLKRLAALSAAAVVMLTAAAWLLWPAQVQVPAVTGKPLAQARAAIEAAGLTLRDGVAVEEESLTAAAGTVIRQDPSAGFQVAKRAPVSIVVAKPPVPVDLSRHVKIRDTGTEGTIAALAAVTAIEVAYAHGGHDARLSERYLYEKAKQHDELQGGEGTWMTAVIYAAEQFGVPPHAMWPYQPNQHRPPQGATWARLDAAAGEHKAQFHRLAAVDGIYAQLRRGRPVLATVRLGPEWENEAAWKTGHIAVDPAAPQRIHGMGVITVVGLDPATGIFRFAHTWGEDWGERGFGTLSIQTATAIVDPQGIWAVEAAARN